MSTILTIIIVIGLVVGLFVFFKSKGEKPAPKRRVSAPQARIKSYEAVKMVLPLSGICCTPAQQLLGYKIAKRDALPLPLSECTMKNQCYCSYETEHVADRRRGQGDRRASSDRRESIRFEDKTDRRSGNERRKSSRVWTE